MSLFGFGDITFNKNSANVKGPLRALEGTQFGSSTLRYPIDVGTTDKSHYVVFYIRQQEKTASQYKASEAGEGSIDSSGASSSISQISSLSKTPGTNFGGELLSKVNSGLSSLNSATNNKISGLTGAISSTAGSIVGGVNNLFGQPNKIFSGDSASSSSIIDNSIKKISGGSLSFLKTTKLTTDAIALYMPDTLNYTYSQTYDGLSIGKEIGGMALSAGKTILDAYKSGDDAALESAIKKTAVELAKQKGGEAVSKALGSEGTGQVLLAATGRVQNPMLEMIYRSPNFRSFQFDFTFYPRSEQEAYEVQKIIERLRFHQAPEILQEAQGFLVPPSEFDIRFYYAGAQNPNIPQIATCVLTNIDTNYAPNGWSAYEVPGDTRPGIGRTGMPVAINLSLQFQETTYLTKADFNLSLAKG
jgi:hypothetical protein